MVEGNPRAIINNQALPYTPQPVMTSYRKK
jgi:hypothetical protein